jgi:hypothetical protein
VVISASGYCGLCTQEMNSVIDERRAAEQSTEAEAA